MSLPENVIKEMKAMGVTPPTEATTTHPSSSARPWDDSQLSVARKIYDIGRTRGESDDHIRAALSAGIVESEFNPRAIGDRSEPDGAAYGVLQQRKAGGYDTTKASDPVSGVEYAANAFYDNARKVSSYKTPGHLAAQVQRPRADLRGRYDQELHRADELFHQFGAVQPSSAPPANVRAEIERITGQASSPAASSQPVQSHDSPITPKPTTSASPAQAAIPLGRTRGSRPTIDSSGLDPAAPQIEAPDEAETMNDADRAHEAQLAAQRQKVSKARREAARVRRQYRKASKAAAAQEMDYLPGESPEERYGEEHPFQFDEREPSEFTQNFQAHRPQSPYRAGRDYVRGLQSKLEEATAVFRRERDVLSAMRRPSNVNTLRRDEQRLAAEAAEKTNKTYRTLEEATREGDLEAAGQLADLHSPRAAELEARSTREPVHDEAVERTAWQRVLDAHGGEDSINRSKADWQTLGKDPGEIDRTLQSEFEHEKLEVAREIRESTPTPEDAADLLARQRSYEHSSPAYKTFVQPFESFAGEVGSEIGNVVYTAGKFITSSGARDVGAYLKRRAELTQAASETGAKGLPTGYKVARSLLSGSLGVAKLISLSEATGFKLATVMAGESVARNLDKDAGTQVSEATKAYLMGKALELVPGALREGAEGLPGAAGRFARTHASATDRAVGATVFGGLGAAESAAQPGSDSSDVIAATAGGAILGGVLSGGSPHEQEAAGRKYEKPFVLNAEDGRSIFVEPKQDSPSGYTVTPVDAERAAELGRQFRAQTVPVEDYDAAVELYGETAPAERQLGAGGQTVVNESPEVGQRTDAAAHAADGAARASEIFTQPEAKGGITHEEVTPAVEAPGPTIEEAQSKQDGAAEPAISPAAPVSPDEDLYARAVEVAREKNRGSTSVLQRELKLGYGDAAKLIDRMEREGIVGPADGANPRRVLPPVASSAASSETAKEAAPAPTPVTTPANEEQGRPQAGDSYRNKQTGEIFAVRRTDPARIFLGERGSKDGPTISRPVAEFAKQFEKTEHKFSSTQVDLPDEAAREVRTVGERLIPDSVVYTDPKDPSFGREEHPHVTVKYGLHDESPEKIQTLLADEPPVTVTLGKLSIFPGKGDTPYDVVKADVDSPDLHRLNKKISEALKVTDTHPEYKPHVTLAYVKRGEGQKFVGDSSLEGKRFTFDAVTFSSSNGETVPVKLGGKASSSKDKQPSRYQLTGVRRRPSFDETAHDLTRFALNAGGVSDAGGNYTGELAGLKPKEGGRIGLVNNKSGVAPDRLRELANEAGFGPFETDNDFLSALAEDAAGQRKHYTRAREQDVDAEFEARAAEDPELAEVDSKIDRALEEDEKFSGLMNRLLYNGSDSLGAEELSELRARGIAHGLSNEVEDSIETHSDVLAGEGGEVSESGLDTGEGEVDFDVSEFGDEVTHEAESEADGAAERVAADGAAQRERPADAAEHAAVVARKDGTAARGDEGARLEDRPAEEVAPVLAHIAGPSGAGKTELMNALRERVKNINLVDLDEFDEKAEEALGWSEVSKQDYTDEMLAQLHEEKQRLVDEYIRESDKPIVFFGHHIEADNELSFPSEQRILLDVSPQTAAINAARRPGKKATDLKKDIRIGQEDVEYLTGRGYEVESPRKVYSKIRALSGKLGKHDKPTQRAKQPPAPHGTEAADATTLKNSPELKSVPARPAEQPSMLEPTGGLFGGEQESAQAPPAHPADIAREKLLAKSRENQLSKLREAFGDDAEDVERLSKSDDKLVRAVASKVLDRAAALRTNKSLDSKDLTLPLKKLADLREQGVSVEEYERQGAMFGAELTPEQTVTLRAYSSGHADARINQLLSVGADKPAASVENAPGGNGDNPHARPSGIKPPAAVGEKEGSDEAKPHHSQIQPRDDEGRFLEGEPARSGERGAASLDLLTLGTARFVKDDVIPTAKEAARLVADSADDIRRLVGAPGRGKDAKLASGLMREKLADVARTLDRAENALAHARKYFASKDKAHNYKFIAAIEGGNVSGLSKEEQRMAASMRSILDSLRTRVQNLGTGKLQTFIADYFPHIWKQPKTAAQVIGQIMGRRPLEGSKSFLKKRTLPTFADGLAAGLEPVSDNPVDLVLLKSREMMRYVAAHEAMGELRKLKLVRYVRVGKQPLPGFTKINDSIGTVYGGKNATPQGGMLIRGQWYASDGAAQIINNHLSPGLRDRSSAYRAYLAAGNALNQFQLGWSAFHLGFTSMDAMVSKLALAINQAATGHPVDALLSAIQTPLAPLTNVLRGARLRREWLAPGSDPAMAAIVEAAVRGGARAKTDDFYRTNAAERMVDAFRKGNVLGGILRAPLGLTDLASKPILEWIVPRQKLGIFADLAKAELKRLGPNVTPEEVREVMGRVWDSVDNRMGQIVYDNLFWNRVIKDLAMGSVRSVGWNLGTLRELGGAATDTLSTPLRVARKFAGKGGKGKPPVVTYRQAYAAALFAWVGLLGAVTTYLYTGEGPKELKDYFFPRTGNLDENGRPERIALPSYVKDVYHYYEHPGRTLSNKLSPLLGLVGEMLRNEDFYGTKIRNEDDPLVTQLKDAAEHVATSALPFAARGAKKEHERGGSLLSKALPFVGVVPAPADLNNTDAEELLSEIRDERSPAKARTKEEAARAQKVRELVREAKLGRDVRKDVDAAIESGELKPSDRETIERRSKGDYLVSGAKTLGVDDLVRVYEAADEGERERLRSALLKKIRNSAVEGFEPRTEARVRRLGIEEVNGILDRVAGSPVAKEMRRLNVKLPDVGESLTVAGRKFELTPEQYEEFRGRVIDASFKRLERLFALPGYASLPDESKRRRIQNVIQKFGSDPARTQMLAELMPDNRRVQTDARKAARRAERTSEADVLRNAERSEKKQQRRYGLK
jgi:2'-5' RNA ligase